MARSKLERAIAGLADAIAKLERATRAGKPATAKQLDALEATLGAPIPKQARAFLALHDGYRGLNVFGDFASSKDLGPRGALRRRVNQLAKADPESLEWDSILPIASVDDSDDFVYMERDGTVVAWFHDMDSERCPDLVAYLVARTDECSKLAIEAPRHRDELANQHAREDADRRDAVASKTRQLDAASAGKLPAARVVQGAWTATEFPHVHERELRAAVELDTGYLAVAEEYLAALRIWSPSGTLRRTIELPAAPSRDWSRRLRAHACEAVAPGRALAPRTKREPRESNCGRAATATTAVAGIAPSPDLTPRHSSPRQARSVRPLRSDHPDGLVVRDRLEHDAGVFKDRALRQHRLQGVHLMGVLQRVPDADVRQGSAHAINSDVVVHESLEARQRIAKHTFAIHEKALRIGDARGVKCSF